MFCTLLIQRRCIEVLCLRIASQRSCHLRSKFETSTARRNRKIDDNNNCGVFSIVREAKRFVCSLRGFASVGLEPKKRPNFGNCFALESKRSSKFLQTLLPFKIPRFGHMSTRCIESLRRFFKNFTRKLREAISTTAKELDIEMLRYFEASFHVHFLCVDDFRSLRMPTLGEGSDLAGKLPCEL